MNILFSFLLIILYLVKLYIVTYFLLARKNTFDDIMPT